VLLLDQLADPRQCPHSAQVSELLGPLLEALFELRYLGFLSLGRPARGALRKPLRPSTFNAMRSGVSCEKL
jgi:hypothetical protein